MPWKRHIVWALDIYVLSTISPMNPIFNKMCLYRVIPSIFKIRDGSNSNTANNSFAVIVKLNTRNLSLHYSHSITRLAPVPSVRVRELQLTVEDIKIPTVSRDSARSG